VNTASLLSASPELQRLAALRDAGWSFVPQLDDGRLVVIVGIKAWIDSGYSDALQVASPTDAAAVRADPDGGVVWQREGTVNDVVDGLLSLPYPLAPGAPRLVKGTAPMLWTPRTS